MSEIKLFLTPIQKDAPCGQSLKGNELVTKISALRTRYDEVIPDNPNNHWSLADKNVSKWKDISILCEEILKTVSKDLNVVGYYIEAQTNLHGFNGLAKGLLLLKELCILYWDQIYPKITNGYPEIRNAPFGWINKNIPIQINLINLSSSQNKQIYFSQYQYKNRHKKDVMLSTENKMQRDIITSLENEPLHVLKNQLEVIQHSYKILTEIEVIILNSNENSEDSILFDFMTCLENIINLFKEVLKLKEKSKKDTGNNEAHTRSPEVDIDLQEIKVVEKKLKARDKDAFFYKPTNREEAYDLIEYSNNILIELEPQSLVPYLIKRALKLRKLPIHELMGEILDSVDDKTEIMSLFGLKKEKV